MHERLAVAAVLVLTMWCEQNTLQQNTQESITCLLFLRLAASDTIQSNRVSNLRAHARPACRLVASCWHSTLIVNHLLSLFANPVVSLTVTPHTSHTPGLFHLQVTVSSNFFGPLYLTYQLLDVLKATAPCWHGATGCHI
jgi:hypothetical protein